MGIWTAREDVRRGLGGEVPPHLRDAHYRGAAKLGHGEGYEYSHDADGGWTGQQYLPDDVVGRRYYEPSPHGAEPGRWASRPGARDRAAAGGGTGEAEIGRDREGDVVADGEGDGD
jgi:putative ATPase